MKKEDFYKGQTVWVYLIGNAARGRKTTEERIQEWEVINITKKYITAKSKTGGREQKFDIENNFCHVHTYGTSNYKLYLTQEEIYEEVERQNRIEYIEQFCRAGRNLCKMSDGELLAVVEIFKQYE